MADGEWEMGDGRWEMEDGRWKMEDGRIIGMSEDEYLTSDSKPSCPQTGRKQL